MPASLRADLKRLSALAYRRGEWGAELMRRIHRLPKAAKRHPDYACVEELRRWLLAPLTLWPVELEGLSRHVVDRIASGARLDKPLRLLLSLLGPPPADAAQAVTAAHEHEVETGRYEPLIRAQFKYDFMEQQLAGEPEFRAEWGRIKAAFDVTRFQDAKKIIRRRMVQERNFRPHLWFRWSRIAERFEAVFDVFCHRWSLYGMKGDRPLLLKLTVNLTPYGTMIFVPAYWSFDPKRDLKWRAITALHKARGVTRQGPKLTLNRMAQRDEAELAQRLWGEATAAGQKGSARIHWVMGQLGWVARTDERSLRKLLQTTAKM